MNQDIQFSFIGGTYRGYKVLNSIIEEGYKPTYIWILKQEEHEHLNYANHLIELAGKNSIPYSVKKKLSEEDYQLIKGAKQDFILVCGWRTLISTEINKFLRFGLVAAHDSLLPRYRGFAPLNWAIINGEKETGITLFKIDEGETDSGKIISQERVSILHEDYAKDVYEKLCDANIVLCRDFFRNYSNGSIQLNEQDHSLATYSCSRVPEDGKINWNDSSIDIYNLVRGLAFPFPGAFCNYQDNMYIIRKASLGRNNKKNYIGRIPGRVIQLFENSVEVLCGKGSIEIIEWEELKTGKIESPLKVITSIKSTIR